MRGQQKVRSGYNANSKHVSKLSNQESPELSEISSIHAKCKSVHNAAESISRMQASQLPVEFRTSVKLNRVERIKSFTEPRRAKGLSDFPLWNNFPLDSKVPDYRSQSWPEGFIYFSRGKLGQSLYTPHKKEFDLSDPKGNQNPIHSSDYTALHDPLAQRYFSYYVIQHLRKHNLINEKNDVLCDAKNYNQFRTYLASVQREAVLEELLIDDEMHLSLAATKKESQTAPPLEPALYSTNHINKVSENKKIKQEIAFIKTNDLERSISKWEQRINILEKRRRERMFKSVQRQTVQEFHARCVLQNNKMKDQQTAMYRFGRLVMREQQADKIKKKMLAKKYLNKAELKYQQEAQLYELEERDKRALQDKELIDEIRQRERAGWVKQYKKDMQQSELKFEKMRALKMAKEERKIWLMRKYFDLWRAFVARVTIDKKDVLHNSLWSVEKDMRKTNIELQSLSGYDKRKSFFKAFIHPKDMTQFLGSIVTDEDKEEDDL